MAGSFLQTAMKQVVDVSKFLKEAADGNGIKYAAESGKQHKVYIPYTEVEVEVDGQKVKKNAMIAIEGRVHEWTDSAGKYNSTVCLEGVVRQAEDGTILNDGSCPFCKRESDAWDIYNYRYQQEEENCQLQGELRNKHLDNCKTNFSNERKAKKAKPYMYILVAQFSTHEDGSAILTEGTQLPAYALKIMKLSSNRVEKIQKQCKNSGVDMVGSELVFDYPANDDIKQVVLNSTVSPVVLENMKLTTQYPAVLEQINNDAAKFEWEGIEKAFPEWKGMTTLEANNIIDGLFHKWDEYQQAKLINPMAKYMEYAYTLQANNPELNPQVPTLNGAATPVIPSIPGAVSNGQPVIPSIPGMTHTQTANGSVGEAVQQTTSQPNIPGMSTAQPVVQQTASQPNIPGMTVSNIPGMSTAQPVVQQSAQPAESSGTATAANQILGGGTPTFQI